MAMKQVPEAIVINSPENKELTDKLTDILFFINKNPLEQMFKKP